MEAQMDRISQQMRASQIGLRHDLLALLMPAQRATVAMLVGELATAADPDVAATGHRIDTLLSPAQRQAVMRMITAEAASREKLFAAMVEQSQRALSQFGGDGSPPPSAPPAVMHGSVQRVSSGTAFALPGPVLSEGFAPSQSAGALLLAVLVSPTSLGGSIPNPMIMRPMIMQHIFPQ